MNYSITSTKISVISLSEDKKSVNVDMSIYGEYKNGIVTLPINTGTTINLPLILGEQLPAELETKTIQWFNENYPSV